MTRERLLRCAPQCEEAVPPGGWNTIWTEAQSSALPPPLIAGENFHPLTALTAALSRSSNAPANASNATFLFNMAEISFAREENTLLARSANSRLLRKFHVAARGQ